MRPVFVFGASFSLSGMSGNLFLVTGSNQDSRRLDSVKFRYVRRTDEPLVVLNSESFANRGKELPSEALVAWLKIDCRFVPHARGYSGAQMLNRLAFDRLRSPLTWVGRAKTFPTSNAIFQRESVQIPCF